jgi:outer membrane cobalamin receptor
LIIFKIKKKGVRIMKIFLGGDYTYHIATFSLSIQHVEGMYGSDNSQKLLENYTNIGAKISVRALPQFFINLSAENLLDKNYQTILGYPMPGKTFSVGINWTML